MPKQKSTFSVLGMKAESVPVYDMKNNCCVIERLFKIQKNGIFLFGMLFLLFKRYWHFCIMQIRKVMTSHKVCY